jgi:antitoxin ParD1/3/4
MEKITIALTSELADFIRNVVDAGEYELTSEAIEHAVREWKERRDLFGYTVEELRALVQDGIDSRPSALATMADVKVEARRRFEAAQLRS